MKILKGGFVFLILFFLVLPIGMAAKKRAVRNGLLDSTNCEVRGVWVDEIETKEKIETIVGNILNANLNTVFVVSPPIGPHTGWSSKRGFDRFVKLAHKRKLNVHIWIPNLYRKKDGSQSNFLDPAERKAQKNWALALMKKYKSYVRGIHFDYIRYYDWQEIDAEKVLAVKNNVTEISRAVRKKYPNKYVTSTSISAVPTWADFSSESVPDWFLNWYNANQSNVYATSYSFKTVPNFMKYQQDPVSWVRDISLDAVMPMQYATDGTVWNQEVGSWIGFLNHVGKEPKRVCMGIGWLEEAGHPEWGYDASGVANKIAYGRVQGLKGFVFYELNGGMKDQELVNILTIDSAENGFDAPFKSKIQSCFLER